MTVTTSEIVSLPTLGAEAAQVTDRHGPRAALAWLGRLRRAERLLGVVLLVALWQILYRTGVTTDETLSGPSAVWGSAWDRIADGSLPSAIWVSLHRVLIGLAVGLPIGVVLALAAGLTRLGDDVVDTSMQMLRFIPIIGLQPLIIVWFGLGETAKISLIVFGVVFPTYINTYHAVRGIDPRMLELGRVIGLGRLAMIRRLVIPGALPGFLVGLRLAFGVSWLLLVFAEQINAREGIGYLIVQAQAFYQTDVILVGLATYAVLGLVSDLLVRGIERVALTWQPSR